MAAKIAMIATTISSSINVKPLCLLHCMWTCSPVIMMHLLRQPEWVWLLMWLASCPFCAPGVQPAFACLLLARIVDLHQATGVSSFRCSVAVLTVLRPVLLYEGLQPASSVP